SLSADELCHDCPELRDAVRLQVELWRREPAGPDSAPDETLIRLDGPSAPGSAPVMPLPGTEPVPGYRLLQRLRKGTFGAVWKATGPGNVPVALKFIRLEGAADRFEARALELMKQLRHPNLLTVAG